MNILFDDEINDEETLSKLKKMRNDFIFDDYSGDNFHAIRFYYLDDRIIMYVMYECESDIEGKDFCESFFESTVDELLKYYNKFENNIKNSTFNYDYYYYDKNNFCCSKKNYEEQITRMNNFLEVNKLKLQRKKYMDDVKAYAAKINEISAKAKKAGFDDNWVVLYNGMPMTMVSEEKSKKNK